MLRAQDRAYTRRDTVLFLGCLLLSVIGLFAPARWGYGIGGALRESVLAPLVWLQQRAEEGRTSRARFQAVSAQRDSAAMAAQFLPVLRAENVRLRELLALTGRLTTPWVAAEVLHQPTATDGRTLLLDTGRGEGVAPFDPVVAPEGLIGMVLTASAGSAVAITWAHPEFRVSAFTENGRAFGIVSPSSGSSASETALELRGVPYRDTVPAGTLVLSSGLGGVYPKGIPLGVVTGVAREQPGWERVYRLRPAAHPSATAHVLVLVAPRDTAVTAAFPSDSILAAARADSLARARTADSALRAVIADSVRRALLRDSAFLAGVRGTAAGPARTPPRRARATPGREPPAPQPARQAGQAPAADSPAIRIRRRPPAVLVPAGRAGDSTP